MTIKMKNTSQKKHSFHDIWNNLSHSQKNILYKLGRTGWQLDHSKCDLTTQVAEIIHYNGDKGKVNSLGEVELSE